MADIPVFHHYLLEILQCNILCRQYYPLLTLFFIGFEYRIALEEKSASNRCLSISLVVGGVAWILKGTLEKLCLKN